MVSFINNMYSFILSILFWIFIWNLFDLILNELKIPKRKQIIFYSVSLIVTTMLIYYNKKFFDFA